MLKKYALWLDGDNFIGIAHAESKEEALELCGNSFKEHIKVLERGISSRQEKSFDDCDDADIEDVKKAGFKSREHAALGLFW